MPHPRPTKAIEQTRPCHQRFTMSWPSLGPLPLGWSWAAGGAVSRGVSRQLSATVMFVEAPKQPRNRVSDGLPGGTLTVHELGEPGACLGQVHAGTHFSSAAFRVRVNLWPRRACSTEAVAARTGTRPRYETPRLPVSRPGLLRRLRHVRCKPDDRDVFLPGLSSSRGVGSDAPYAPNPLQTGQWQR
jgi:hypothetical protein